MMSILVIDDSDVDIELIQEAIGDGAQFTSAKSGFEALDILREGLRPNLIFLDINMPGLNGFSVLKEIKKDPETRPIPVIILSTSKDPGDVRTSYEAAAACYVAKSTRFADLKRSLDAVRTFFTETVLLPKPL